MNYEWVNDYIGVPYLVNGRDRNGWDCWGLVMAVLYEQKKLAITDWKVVTTGSPKANLADSISRIAESAKEMLNDGRIVQIDKPEDFAIVTIHRHKLPNHVGIVIAGGVLHCASTNGGTIYEPLGTFQRIHGNLTFWKWADK